VIQKPSITIKSTTPKISFPSNFLKVYQNVHQLKIVRDFQIFKIIIFQFSLMLLSFSPYLCRSQRLLKETLFGGGENGAEKGRGSSEIFGIGGTDFKNVET
jgi:hypothetical protein